MEIKTCPVCNSPMNYNTAGLQKNAKAPHWKCSDPTCKKKWDKGSKTWIDGEYVTAQWDETTPSQATGGSVSPSTPQTATPQQPDRAYWEKKEARTNDNIRWANALNNACLLVANDKYTRLVDSTASNEPVKTVEQEMYDLANYIYKLKPQEKQYEMSDQEEEDIRAEEIPF